MNFLKSIFTILVSLHCVFGLGQNDTVICEAIPDSLNGKIYLFVDKMPEPQKGNEYLYKALFKKVKFPKGLERTLNGSLTIISFVINEQGEITNEQIEREDFEGMEIPKQMFEVVASMKWLNDSCQGIPVSVRYNLPLRICLR